MPALGRNRVVDQMEQGAGPGQVKVSGIPVPLRNGYLTKRNLRPLQTESRQVHAFDALPAPESMQAIFEPVMIPGHDEEQDEAGCEHEIAEKRPAKLMRNDGTEEARGKNRETSRGKPRADATPGCFELPRAPKCMDEMLLTAWVQSW